MKYSTDCSRQPQSSRSKRAKKTRAPVQPTIGPDPDQRLDTSDNGQWMSPMRSWEAPWTRVAV